MFTLRPVQSGQNSLVLSRISVGLQFLPDPAVAPVTAVMGDDGEKKVVGWGQYDPQAFLWIVNQLFPGALKDSPKEPGTISCAEASGAPKEIRARELMEMINQAALAVTSVVKGMQVLQAGPPEIVNPVIRRATIDQLVVDNNGLVRLRLEHDNSWSTATFRDIR